MVFCAVGKELTAYTLLIPHQDTTNKAARLELSRSYSSAFAAYVRAGELYLWLVRNINNRNPRGLGSSTTEAELRDRLRKAAAKVLERAERIKQVKSDVRPVERHTLSEGAHSVSFRWEFGCTGRTGDNARKPCSFEKQRAGPFCSDGGPRCYARREHLPLLG